MTSNKFPKLTKKKSYYLFASIIFYFIAFPATAASKCEVDISVSEFSRENETSRVSTSVEEAFLDHSQESPFINFARETSSYIKDLAGETFCEGQDGQPKVSISLVFAVLPKVERYERMETWQTLISQMNSPYVKITERKAEPEEIGLRIVVLWNPRQMLIDRLSLDGVELDRSSPVLPFEQEEFWNYVKKFRSNVIDDPNLGKEDLVHELNDLKKSMGVDLFELTDRSPLVTRIPFTEVVKKNYQDLVEGVWPGYLEVVKWEISREIRQNFKTKISSKPDLKELDLQSIYTQEFTWGENKISSTILDILK